MIALNPGSTALTAFQTGDLFAFAVQLLHLPAIAVCLLDGRRGDLSPVVRHDPIRVVSGHLTPEQLHLVVFGKASGLDGFTVRLLDRAPGQRTDPLAKPRPAGIIHLDWL
jgi:hypothetical protein